MSQKRSVVNAVPADYELYVCGHGPLEKIKSNLVRNLKKKQINLFLGKEFWLTLDMKVPSQLYSSARSLYYKTFYDRNLRIFVIS